MKQPYVRIRPKKCCGQARRNKFYRAILEDLPKAHQTRPWIKVSLRRLPELMDRAVFKMRSKSALVVLILALFLSQSADARRLRHHDRGDTVRKVVLKRDNNPFSGARFMDIQMDREWGPADPIPYITPWQNGLNQTAHQMIAITSMLQAEFPHDPVEVVLHNLDRRVKVLAAEELMRKQMAEPKKDHWVWMRWVLGICVFLGGVVLTVAGVFWWWFNRWDYGERIIK